MLTRLLALGAAIAVAAACAGAADAAQQRRPAVRLLFAGDVMLGRGVARVAANDPAALLAGIRLQVRSADLAVANLESPLTTRPHERDAGPNVLEASPSSARLLAAAGFDAMGVANNHAGDAGRGGVTDTARALADAGVAAVGEGSSQWEAFSPRIVEAGGLRVALLAFDATGRGLRAAWRKPGISWWDEALARAAVRSARASADVVAVGIHGGAEYVPASDPYLLRIGRLLASWGVDIVWGHGPHVVQPIHVLDPDGDGRPTVVATSLGNLLFDQRLPGTRRGAILEVLAGSDGVRALRAGVADHEQGPVSFLGWRAPTGDAAAVGGEWWRLARAFPAAGTTRPRTLAGFRGEVVDAALGDVDRDGRTDLAVAFRRPFSPTPVNVLVDRHLLVDRRGRSAHLGLYRPRDLRPRWVAGLLLRPVAAVAACHGAIAVVYTTLDDLPITGTGAWLWGGFGFVPLPDLSGRGVPGCADVDGDGSLDPVILERSSQ